MRMMMKNAWMSRLAVVLAALGAAGLGPAACSDASTTPSPEAAAEHQGAVKITIAAPAASADASQKPNGSGSTAGEGEQSGYQTMSASFAAVSSILINVTIKAGNVPQTIGFPLEKGLNGTWSGDIPFLPLNTTLTFVASARDASGIEIFNGAGEKSFDGTTDQTVSLMLAASDNNATYQLPRCEQIAVPIEFVSGESNSISFYLRGQTNETLTYTITPAGGGGSFSPQSGQVTLVGTSVSLFVEYTAPTVTAAQAYTHIIKITNSSGNAISTTFATNVVPESTTDGEEVAVGITFNPSIQSLGGHRVEGSDHVTWTAAVSDDNGLAGLSYAWGFTLPNGTPPPTIPFGPLTGQDVTNPSTFSGYTPSVEGTLTLEVRDGDSGLTTLHYNVQESLFPENVEFDPSGLAEIRAGGAHTCARYHSGIVRCWGRNNVGQLGLGNTSNIGDTELPSSVVSHATIVGEAKQIVMGSAHTCALMKTGLVYCWGDGQYGQLGYHNTLDVGGGGPVTSAGFVSLAGAAVRLAAGGDHTCAVMSTGNVICWGRNNHGQLGYGHPLTQNAGDNEFPYESGNVSINSPGQNFTVKDLALGASHTCALLSNDSVKCWGYNAYGQLGYESSSVNNNGLLVPSSVGFVEVGGPVQKVIAGENHTCALLKTGGVRCWGRNDLGQLGNGTWQHFSDTEVWDGDGQAVNFNDVNLQVVDIAAGANHNCAVVGGGGVRCWGQGVNGKTGYGDQNPRNVPGVNLNLGGNSAARITAGAEHSCVFLTTGTVRCWGQGTFGQLGYNSSQNLSLPGGNVSISPPTP